MRISHLALALLVTMIWGSNFSVIKWSLAGTDPLLMAALRFTLCALPAVFFIPRPQVRWSYLVTYGVLFGSMVWGLCNLGIAAGLSAGLTSLVVQASAFFSVGLSAYLYRETLGWHQKLGGVLAAAGLLLIFLVTDGSVTVKGVLLALAGAFCWALSNFVVKEARTPQMLGFLVWSCLFAPLPLFGISYCQHDAAYIVSQIQQLHTPVWLALLYQVYVATLFGYTVWNALMRRYSVSQVAPLSLMVPVFGMSLSAWLFAEALGAQKLLAATLVLLGLLINVFGPRLLNRLLQPRSV